LFNNNETSIEHNQASHDMTPAMSNNNTTTTTVVINPTNMSTTTIHHHHHHQPSAMTRGDEPDFDLSDVAAYRCNHSEVNAPLGAPSNSEFDDSKEDSSGYYSSYHSVDLISSSGGSVGGDLLLGLTRCHKTAPNGQLSSASNHYLATAAVSNHNPNQDASKATLATVTTTPATTTTTTQHHYHTRYSNLNSKPSAASPASVQTVANAKHGTLLHTSNTPTTRLRYHQLQQQQLMATNTNCDLDLDQIEND
jgi:hypothetical protein